jgi:hypothetical protein
LLLYFIIHHFLNHFLFIKNSFSMKKNQLLALFFLLTPPIFLAAQNNGAGCAKAIPATLGTYTVDSMFRGVATFGSVYPLPSRAIWYKYTPPTDGLLTISSCSGGADTRLFLYTGTCAQLALAAFSDDYCDFDGSGEPLAANIAKPVKAGTAYFFEFDSAWDSIPFTFSLSLTTFTPRATQVCTTATPILPGITTVDSLFGYASRGDAARANWYKFTPLRNGKIGINTCNVDVDTRLWVYRGTCTALVSIADSDDDCPSSSGNDYAVSIQNLDVTAGQTYYFEFDDAGENSDFPFVLTYDVASSVADNRLSQSVNLAPNPATDVVDIVVELDKTSDLTVKIFNTVGQQLVSEKMDKILRGSLRLNTSALKSGVYIVEVSDRAAKTRKKLVINH